MEGSLVAYKVFTNGSTLQASEVNDNLMKQAVATFSNAAARTAAITSPVEGQLTYLEDTNIYQHWNGSSWVSPFGATLVASVPFSATSTVAVDNCFTSAYENYRVVIQFIIDTVASQTTIRLRSGGSAISTSTYQWEGSRSISAGIQRIQGTDGSGWTLGTGTGVAERSFISMDLYNPALPALTGVEYRGFAYDGAKAGYTLQGQERANASRDGIQFVVAGTMTGILRIYGYRNE